MKQLFKYIYHKTIVGRIMMNLYHFLSKRIIPDSVYLKFRYKKRFGKFPNLKDPKTLNEKIIWLKLNDRTPLHTRCADKYEVRGFIKETIGEEYLVPIYFQTKNVDEIIADNLPDTPCIIKTNHDSGGGIFVLDKSKMNWEDIQQKLKKRLEKNYYLQSKEWQYKHINPRIIVEKLLQNSNGTIPNDFKIHCINGEPKIIQIDSDRFSNHKRNLYDVNWKLLPFTWSRWENKRPLWDNGPTIHKPKSLNTLLNLAKTLSKDFYYSRIDFYVVDEKIYFGEITFHHGGGTEIIFPKEWDLKLGSELVLK